MQFKEMKTLTTLLQPTNSGWNVVHKKYKDPYGTIVCSENETVFYVTTSFGENTAQRTEAVEAVQRAIFSNTNAKEIVTDGESLLREAWQAEQDKFYSELRKTREDYADVLGKPVHCVMDRPLGSAHPRYPEML